MTRCASACCWRARSRPATARSSTISRPCAPSARARSRRSCPCACPARSRRSPPLTARSRPSPGARAGRSAWPSRARSATRWRSLPLAPVVGASAGVPAGKASPARAIDVGLGDLGGSFMWAIRRPSDGHSVSSYNGPQLGYPAPSTFVELDLHGPATDVRGGTAPGVPIMGLGHNAHVAWGFTSGLSDNNDLYAERLAGPGSRRYRFRGRELTMSCRRAVFRYRAGDAARAVPRPCRSVHGPVQAESGAGRLRPPLRAVEARGRDHHRADRAQRREQPQGRRPRPAPGELEREHHRRRRRRRHRLLAPRPAPAAPAGLGRAPAATRAPARPSGAACCLARATRT